KLGAEDLPKQLLAAPELSLDAVPHTTRNLLAAAQVASARGQTYAGHAQLRAQRADLVGLPMQMGKDCHLGKEPAEALQVLSRKLRVQIQAAVRQGDVDFRPNAETLRDLLLLGEQRGDWLKPDAVPALMQLLQAENTPLRQLL